MAGKEARAHQLEAEAANPDLWQDPSHAQEVMRQLAHLKEEVAGWMVLEKEIRDALELAGMPELASEVEAEAARLEAELGKREFQLSLGGPYDARNAILAIHAGAGGTESQDWAQMLLSMYLRWAERRHFQAQILDTSPGEEAGIKSAAVEVKGDYAYGYLRSERGVHRLVRLSPFNADHLRHTSFALVEVLPEAESDVEVNIGPDDLRIDTFRSSGAGGQNVQKVSSAVRITHLPTGLVISCQNERSQHQNKETALRILMARLIEMEVKKREEEVARLKGEHVSAGWGNQIRSYVLHPYRMVKDHRTDHETSNALGVLEGDLDGFMEAYLRSALGRASV
ncbi:MAG: peptide chain release factor 2 [Chloroflexi bacterium]|nr:peptide chain release factor 2 [Chloroflexota bacterium]